MSDEHTTLLQESRVLIRDQKKLATCLGFGPRFLHSTGQAYKGGPNTGVFLQITCDHEEDVPVQRAGERGPALARRGFPGIGLDRLVGLRALDRDAADHLARGGARDRPLPRAPAQPR